MMASIYSLADYENSGSLLELYEESFASTKDEVITSGYLTEESMANNNKRKLEEARILNGGRKSNKQKASDKQSGSLLWWQLIENDQQDPLLDLYRVQVLHLCSSLHKKVSPFLITSPSLGGRLVKGSRSLQQQQQQDKLAPNGDLDAATARRLSWRRLAARGRTCSESGEQMRRQQEPEEAQCLLEKWIQSGDLKSLKNARASWSISSSKRGKYGESLVHILIMNQTNQHLTLLVILLHLFPLLANDVFESLKFKGVTCLHLSIGYANERLLMYLLASSKSLIDKCVSGTLFRLPIETGLIGGKESPTRTKTSRVSSFSSEQSYWCDHMHHWPTADGHAHLLLFQGIAADALGHQQPIYLGATPLSWSISFNARTMFELLIAAGANPNAPDSFGNAGLHQLVINNQLGWTRFLVKFGAQTDAINSAAFTPLLLACHLGRVELFNELLELSASEFWSYSMIRCSGYPLNSLDSLLAKDSAPSAMSVILESQVSDNEQKSQLLSSAVVKKLLEEKWQIFAKRLFYHELLLTLIHLLLITFAISLRPNTQVSSQLPSNEIQFNLLDQQALNAIANWLWSNRQQFIRHFAELSSVFISSFQLIRFANEWRRYGNVSLQWTYNPFLPSFVAANGLIVLCALSRLLSALTRAELSQFEDVLLIFAAPLLWSSLLFFIASLCGHDQCIFFVNYKLDKVEKQTSGFDGKRLFSYVKLCMDLFKMTLGVYDLQPYRHSTLARLFFLLFLYLIPILFNMLIAMMNNTYSLIISQSERAWSFQWARALFALERRLNERQKSAYLRLYSINMPAPAEKQDESIKMEATSGQQKFVPALMIIKRMSCTRAERRRLILGYWKKSIRSVLNQIKGAI